MIMTEQEIKRLYKKRLYNEAFYWHFVHKGYSEERAQFEAMRASKLELEEEDY